MPKEIELSEASGPSAVVNRTSIDFEGGMIEPAEDVSPVSRRNTLYTSILATPSTPAALEWAGPIAGRVRASGPLLPPHTEKPSVVLERLQTALGTSSRSPQDVLTRYRGGEPSSARTRSRTMQQRMERVAQEVDGARGGGAGAPPPPSHAGGSSLKRLPPTVIFRLRSAEDRARTAETRVKELEEWRTETVSELQRVRKHLDHGEREQKQSSATISSIQNARELELQQHQDIQTALESEINSLKIELSSAQNEARSARDDVRRVQAQNIVLEESVAVELQDLYTEIDRLNLALAEAEREKSTYMMGGNKDQDIQLNIVVGAQDERHSPERRTTPSRGADLRSSSRLEAGPDDYVTVPMAPAEVNDPRSPVSPGVPEEDVRSLTELVDRYRVKLKEWSDWSKQMRASAAKSKALIRSYMRDKEEAQLRVKEMEDQMRRYGGAHHHVHRFLAHSEPSCRVDIFTFVQSLFSTMSSSFLLLLCPAGRVIVSTRRSRCSKRRFLYGMWPSRVRKPAYKLCPSSCWI